MRVIDLYCLKPLDSAALAENVRATGGRVVTVEDHYAEGGLGETVLTALAEAGVAPRRGSPAGCRSRAAFGPARRTARRLRHLGAARRGRRQTKLLALNSRPPT